MAQPTALDQYMLELTNAERAQAGAQPLAFDTDLNDAADQHSEWMIATDTFSHTGQNGSTPTDRIKAAGYELSGSWTDGENIAWASTRPPAGNQDEVDLLNTNLMNSPGHRANILNDDFRQVGIGVGTGVFQGHDSALTTEDFAGSSSGPFLTGVAFNDRDGDKAYDPGEGVGGVTVTAKGASGDPVQTTTMDAGGYQLELAPGTYDVTFSGNGITDTDQKVTVGDKNVKLDLVDPAAAPATSQADAPATAPDLTTGSTTQPSATGDQPTPGSTTASSGGQPTSGSAAGAVPVLVDPAAAPAASPTDNPAAAPDLSAGSTTQPGVTGDQSVPGSTTASSGGQPTSGSAAGAIPDATSTGALPGTTADDGSTSPTGSDGQGSLGGHGTTTNGHHGRNTLAGHGSGHGSSHAGHGHHGDAFSLASLLDAGGFDGDVLTGFGPGRGRTSGTPAASNQEMLQPNAAGQVAGLADQLTPLLAEHAGALQSRLVADIHSHDAEMGGQLSNRIWGPGVDLGSRQA